jgi:hypothetical protein
LGSAADPVLGEFVADVEASATSVGLRGIERDGPRPRVRPGVRVTLGCAGDLERPDVLVRRWIEPGALGQVTSRRLAAIFAKNHPLLRRNRSSYFHQLERAVARADAVSVNHRVATLLASYFDVLFAVNRVPHPGEKRLVAIAAAACGRTPPGFAAAVPSLIAAIPGAEVVGRAAALVDGLDSLLSGSSCWRYRKHRRHPSSASVAGWTWPVCPVGWRAWSAWAPVRGWGGGQRRRHGSGCGRLLRRVDLAADLAESLLDEVGLAITPEQERGGDDQLRHVLPGRRATPGCHKETSRRAGSMKSRT